MPLGYFVSTALHSSLINMFPLQHPSVEWKQNSGTVSRILHVSFSRWGWVRAEPLVNTIHCQMANIMREGYLPSCPVLPGKVTCLLTPYNAGRVSCPSYPDLHRPKGPPRVHILITLWFLPLVLYKLESFRLPLRVILGTKKKQTLCQ